jgi:hypothetical protein
LDLASAKWHYVKIWMEGSSLKPKKVFNRHLKNRWDNLQINNLEYGLCKGKYLWLGICGSV